MTTPNSSKQIITPGNATTLASAIAAAGMALNAHAAGSDKLKVGWLGCGGRGNGAIRQNLDADSNTEVIAVADLFESKARSGAEKLSKEQKYSGRIKIKDDHIFWGYDCHEKLAKTDCDVIVMATAPAFRGRQMMAAVTAKKPKSIFTEKPVASDVAGCRLVMQASKIATEKGLAIVCGTQRRHEFARIELMKRIHAGELGDLVGGQCYWYGGGIWYRADNPGKTELDWQCHNWYHFNWISGDQICEQHIHNIDVMNWCFGGPPKEFTAVGGRACRDYSADARKVCKMFHNGSEEGWEKYNGDIWDHVFAEFVYPNGARCTSFSGHSPGTGRGREKLVGTKGTSDCSGSMKSYKGDVIWRYDGQHVNGQEQEHIDLMNSIRKGAPLNEGQRIAESTLTAIGARTAAYTGRKISWDWLLNASKQDLVPSQEALMSGKGHFNPIATGADELI